MKRVGIPPTVLLAICRELGKFFYSFFQFHGLFFDLMQYGVESRGIKVMKRCCLWSMYFVLSSFVLSLENSYSLGYSYRYYVMIANQKTQGGTNFFQKGWCKKKKYILFG